MASLSSDSAASVSGASTASVEAHDSTVHSAVTPPSTTPTIISLGCHLCGPNASPNGLLLLDCLHPVCSLHLAVSEENPGSYICELCQYVCSNIFLIILKISLALFLFSLKKTLPLLLHSATRLRSDGAPMKCYLHAPCVKAWLCAALQRNPASVKYIFDVYSKCA